VRDPGRGVSGRGAGRALEIVTVVLLCGCALLSGVFAVLLTPFRVGAALVPVSVLIALVANVVLPVLAGRLIGAGWAAALPWLCWFVTVVALGMTPRAEGDVLLPGGGAQEWVSLATVFVGAIAGVATLAWLSGALDLRRR